MRSGLPGSRSGRTRKCTLNSRRIILQRPVTRQSVALPSGRNGRRLLGSGVHINEGHNPYQRQSPPRSPPQPASSSARRLQRAPNRPPAAAAPSRRTTVRAADAASPEGPHPPAACRLIFHRMVVQAATNPKKKLPEQETAYQRRRIRRPQYDKSRKATRGTHQQRLPPAGPRRNIESINLPARDKKTHVQRGQTGSQTTDRRPANRRVASPAPGAARSASSTGRPLPAGD